MPLQNHVIVTDTKAQIFPGSEDGGELTLKNLGPADVFIGCPMLTLANGYILSKDEVISVNLSPTHPIYGMIETGKEARVCWYLSCGHKCGNGGD